MSVTFEAKNLALFSIFDVRLIVSYPVIVLRGAISILDYYRVGIGIGIAILGAVRAVQISEFRDN